MFLAASQGLTMGDALLTGTLGYALVFVGLIALMIVVTLIGKAFTKKNAEAPAAAPAVEPTAEPVVVTVTPVEGPVAPGSAGKLKIYNVPPKTAAMLMAIVANQMGKPLNELRFISIKEVK